MPYIVCVTLCNLRQHSHKIPHCLHVHIVNCAIVELASSREPHSVEVKQCCTRPCIAASPWTFSHLCIKTAKQSCTLGKESHYCSKQASTRPTVHIDGHVHQENVQSHCHSAARRIPRFTQRDFACWVCRATDNRLRRTVRYLVDAPVLRELSSQINAP